MSANGNAKRLKCGIRKLDWTTAYSYEFDAKLFELTLPFETMKALCLKHNIYPLDGVGEVSFAAFRDWLYRHRRARELFYGDKGFDIQSLVDLLGEDLKGTAKIWDNTKTTKEGKQQCNR